MENSRVGYQKLLVARSDKRGRTICGEMQSMSTDEEQDRGSSRKVEIE